jgi:ABC-type multidrug transport system fused ATPase/permease subunit
LLPYSIWENLRIVATDEEEITRAAQTLGLSEVVASLPDGWETLVAQLSGGQRQLVAMTRAFLKPAPLLLLDEPTSHLDLYAERRACEGMRTLAGGRTAILTTHRVLNLDWVDDILVIAGGRVIESGSFGELLRSHGVFASFHERQSLEAPRLRNQSLHC